MRTLLIFFFLSANTLANDVVIDRYTLIEPNASAEQQFPLIEVKTLTIPTRIALNSEAVNYVLTGTGYELAKQENRSQADRVLMDKRLADINRQFTNITVHEMLKAIAGVGYVPIIDPINRLIAFEKDHAF